MSLDNKIENSMSETSGERPVNPTVSRLSRRSFLKRAGGAALGLVGLAALRGTSTPQSAEAANIDNNTANLNQGESIIILGAAAAGGLAASEVLARQNQPLLSEVKKDLEDCRSSEEQEIAQDVELVEDLSWIKNVSCVDGKERVINEEMTAFVQASFEKFVRAAAVSPKMKALVDSWKAAIENSPNARSFEKIEIEVNYKELSPEAVPETGLYFMIPQPRLYKDTNKVGLTFVIFPDVIRRFDIKPGGLFSLVNIYKCDAYRKAFKEIMEGSMSLGSNLNDEGYDGSLVAPKIQSVSDGMYKDSFNGFTDLIQDQGLGKKKDPKTGQLYIEDDISRYAQK